LIGIPLSITAIRRQECPISGHIGANGYFLNVGKANDHRHMSPDRTRPLDDKGLQTKPAPSSPHENHPGIDGLMAVRNQKGPTNPVFLA